MKRRMLLIAIAVLTLLLGGVTLAGAAPAPDECDIWGRVCVDTDQDGRCDPGERSLARVKIQLLDDGGGVVATTWTETSGNYRFTLDQDDEDFDAGDDYAVVETDPEGYESIYPNRFDFEVEPGERVHAGDFCDVVAEQPAPEPMRCTLATRVYIDYRRDGIYQEGLDTPLANVPVTLTFADGSSIMLESTSAGWVYFSGFEAEGGVTVSVDLPEQYKGCMLDSCPNSPRTVYLGPEDFHMDHASVQFTAHVIGEAAGR